MCFASIRYFVCPFTLASLILLCTLHDVSDGNLDLIKTVPIRKKNCGELILDFWFFVLYIFAVGAVDRSLDNLFYLYYINYNQYFIIIYVLLNLKPIQI